MLNKVLMNIKGITIPNILFHTQFIHQNNEISYVRVNYPSHLNIGPISEMK